MEGGEAVMKGRGIIVFILLETTLVVLPRCVILYCWKGGLSRLTSGLYSHGLHISQDWSCPRSCYLYKEKSRMVNEIQG